MHPDLHINCFAIIAAAVASFLFGWAWYGPLFGKKWAKLVGMDNKKPNKKVVMRGMALTGVAVLLTSYVLAHANQVWHPSVWNAGTDQEGYVYAFFGAFFTWLGFYIPGHLKAVAWCGAKLKLVCIEGAYDFLNLFLIGLVLAYFPFSF